MANLDIIEVRFDGGTFSDMEGALRHFGEEALADMRKLEGELRDDVYGYLHRVYKKLEEKHGSPWAPTFSGGNRTLFRRSGAGLQDILNSITVRTTSDGVEGSISVRGYMAVHETGGEIRAKGKYLTIPLPAALDGRGMPLKPTARDWDDTFVQRSKKGNLLIFQKRGREIVPLYVLKPRVYIPPRLGLGDTLDEEMGYFEKKAFERVSAALGAN